MKKILMVLLTSLFAVSANAQTVVEQGKGGQRGAWLVNSQQALFTSSSFEEVLVDVTATGFPHPTGTVQTAIQNLGPKPIYCGFDSGTLSVNNGFRLNTGEVAIFSTTTLLYCITTVKQLATAATRYLTTNVAGSFFFAGGGGGGGSTTSTDFAPGVPANVSCSANVSCAITGLTASKTYQFSCSADFSYRVGAATPTAVATDNDAKAGVMYRQMLGSTSTAFAFISSSAMTCKAGLVPDS